MPDWHWQGYAAAGAAAEYSFDCVDCHAGVYGCKGRLLFYQDILLVQCSGFYAVLCCHKAESVCVRLVRKPLQHVYLSAVAGMDFSVVVWICAAFKEEQEKNGFQAV